MKTSKKDQIRCPKSNLKTVKKAQEERRKITHTQPRRKLKSKKTESVPLDKKALICNSCRRLRISGKDTRARRTDPKTKENLRKLRNYLNAFILSTFSAVVPTCISYAS